MYQGVGRLSHPAFQSQVATVESMQSSLSLILRFSLKSLLLTNLKLIQSLFGVSALRREASRTRSRARRVSRSSGVSALSVSKPNMASG